MLIVHAVWKFNNRDGGVFVMVTMFRMIVDGNLRRRRLSRPLRCAVAKKMGVVERGDCQCLDYAKGFCCLLLSGGSSNERSHGSGGAGVSAKIGALIESASFAPHNQNHVSKR